MIFMNAPTPHIVSIQLFGRRSSYFYSNMFADEVLTCRQGEGDQVSEEVAGEVSFALVKRGRYLATDLLCQLRANHSWNTLGCLLGHLQRREDGGMERVSRKSIKDTAKTFQAVAEVKTNPKIDKPLR